MELMIRVGGSPSKISSNSEIERANGTALGDAVSVQVSRKVRVMRMMKMLMLMLKMMMMMMVMVLLLLLLLLLLLNKMLRREMMSGGNYWLLRG